MTMMFSPLSPKQTCTEIFDARHWRARKLTHISPPCLRVSVVIFVLTMLSSSVFAQNLRYDNHRKVGIPEYAVIRIGPFYSNMTFSQTAGYRWTQSKGSGTDYTYANRRGTIKEDGSELPLISTLDTRNYLFITEHMDVDLSVRIRYEYYPLETQEGDFFVQLPEEGMDGSLSSSFQLTPVIRGTVYDNARYQTDYVDTRGMEDVFGGQRYEYFRNTAGVNLDWRPSLIQNVAFSASRSDNIPFEDEFEDQEYVSYRESLSYSQMIIPGLIAGVSADYSQYQYASTNRDDAELKNYNLFIRGGAGKSDQVELSSRSTITMGIGFGGGYSKSKETTQNLDSESDSEGGVGHIALKTQLTRNMSHRIGARRSYSGGFSTSFQKSDTYSYNLNWKGRRSSAGFYSRYSFVEPSGSDYSEYSDWVNGIKIESPLVRDVKLRVSSTYVIRDNSEESFDDADGEDPRSSQEIEEQDNDYSTWTSRIGTGFPLSEKMGFMTYYQHTERYSDSGNLEYERDSFEARVTYRHVF